MPRFILRKILMFYAVVFSAAGATWYATNWIWAVLVFFGVSAVLAGGIKDAIGGMVMPAILWLIWRFWGEMALLGAAALIFCLMAFFLWHGRHDLPGILQEIEEEERSKRS